MSNLYEAIGKITVNALMQQKEDKSENVENIHIENSICTCIKSLYCSFTGKDMELSNDDLIHAINEMPRELLFNLRACFNNWAEKQTDLCYSVGTVAVDALETLHNKWVEENSAKIISEKNEYQLMPLEYLAWRHNAYKKMEILEPLLRCFSEENDKCAKMWEANWIQEQIHDEFYERNSEMGNKLYNEGPEKIIEEYATLKSAKITIDNRTISVYDYIKSDPEFADRIIEDYEERYSVKFSKHSR